MASILWPKLSAVSVSELYHLCISSSNWPPKILQTAKAGWFFLQTACTGELWLTQSPTTEISLSFSRVLDCHTTAGFDAFLGLELLSKTPSPANILLSIALLLLRFATRNHGLDATEGAGIKGTPAILKG